MLLLLLMLPVLLLNAPLVMQAVRTSCRLFVFSVMPGLFPYLTAVLMLTSRLGSSRPAWLVLLLGWCGGSPAGARLLRSCPEMSAATLRRLAVTCATMSPMFLLGTVPVWLQCSAAGPVLLTSVLAGGWLAGLCANLLLPAGIQPASHIAAAQEAPCSFGEAVEASARTMLLVCGMMAMLRAAAELCGHYLSPWPALCLALQTLLEVTGGIEQLAALPVPMAWRTALTAGAAGFGGMAILLQNRAVLPSGVLSFKRQAVLQALHGLWSFIIAFSLAVLLKL